MKHDNKNEYLVTRVSLVHAPRALVYMYVYNICTRSMALTGFKTALNFHLLWEVKGYITDPFNKAFHMKENRKPKKLITFAEMAKNLRSVTGPPIDAVDSSTSSPSSVHF